MSDLVEVCHNVLKDLGAPFGEIIHTTRLKNRILNVFTLQDSQSPEKGTLPCFNSDVDNVMRSAMD